MLVADAPLTLLPRMTMLLAAVPMSVMALLTTSNITWTAAPASVTLENSLPDISRLSYSVRDAEVYTANRLTAPPPVLVALPLMRVLDTLKELPAAFLPVALPAKDTTRP